MHAEKGYLKRLGAAKLKMKVELEKVVFEEKLTCDHLDQSRCIMKDHVANITNV